MISSYFIFIFGDLIMFNPDDSVRDTRTHTHTHARVFDVY